MGRNRLAIASVLLVALVGATVLTMNARQAEDTGSASAEVDLPKVDKDKVDALEVSAPDKPKVKLVKTASGWRVAEPVDAEADQTAVDSALSKLAELEVTGVAATNDKNHEMLEVTADKSARVKAMQGDQVLIDAHIGRYRSGSTMVRKEGDVAVAAVKGSIRYAFTKEVREWRNREITKVEAGDVVELQLDNDKGSFHFVRDGEDWKPAEGQAEIENFDASKVKSLVGSAVSLRAVDFAEAGVTPEQAGVAGEQVGGTFTLTLGGDAGENQIVYRVGSKKDQNFYLQREGVDTIFLVSSFLGGRLTSGADQFQKTPEPEKPSNVIEATPVPRPVGQTPIPIRPGPPNPHSPH